MHIEQALTVARAVAATDLDDTAASLRRIEIALNRVGIEADLIQPRSTDEHLRVIIGGERLLISLTDEGGFYAETQVLSHDEYGPEWVYWDAQGYDHAALVTLLSGEDLSCVTVRRWFQRTWGNTYFVARLDRSGAVLLPYEYGYGTYGEYQVAKALGYPAPRQARENGYLITSVDVQRKRDM